MDTYTVRQGSSLIIDVTIRDTDGNAITTYDGTQPLTSTCWPGGDRSAAFSATTTWVNPSAGTIAISFTGVESLTLDPGRYQIMTRLTDAGELVDVYGCTLDVTEAPGVMTAPKVYTTYSDLLAVGRSALRQVQTDDDQAGFAQQQGEAREWLDQILVSYWNPGQLLLSAGDPGYGALSMLSYSSANVPSRWLRDQLDLNKLIVRPLVRKLCAYKACAYIFEGMISTGDAGKEYQDLARRYHFLADGLVKTLKAEIDLSGSGYPSFSINCGVSRIGA